MNDLLKEIKRLSKAFGVKRIVILKRPGMYGKSFLNTDSIGLSIDLFNDVDCLYSIAFHEFGHIWCKNNGKFKIFHNCAKKDLTEYEKYIIVKTAWKAEVYVDKWAKAQLNQSHPNIKFTGNYINATKHSKQVWKDSWLSQFKTSEFQ